MKKLLLILFVLIISSCSPQDPKSTTSDKLIERDNISFFEDSETPFTGEVIDYDVFGEKVLLTGYYLSGKKDGQWKTYHKNGSLKMIGNFVDGKKEGQWNIYFINPKDGNPVQEYEEFYTDGKKDGIFLQFEETGRVRNSTEWVNGVFKEYIEFGLVGDGSGRSGSFQIWRYDKNNKIFEIKYPRGNNNNDGNLFKDKNYKGDIYCKVTDKQTGITTSHNSSHTDGRDYSSDGLSFETWKDCELNGEYESYWETFITRKGSYKDNKKTGKWTYFNQDTGVPTKIENYKDDKLNGLVQEYDKFGNGILKSETEYVDGNRDGLYKRYTQKTQKVDLVETYVQDKRTKSIYYTNLSVSRPLYVMSHFDFWNVMTPFKVGFTGPQTEQGLRRPTSHDRYGVSDGKWGWIYTKGTKIVCRKSTKKDEPPRCFSPGKTYIFPDTPIVITTSYQGGKEHGTFEISDPDDGHIYTSIEYFRGGKVGEYKITNKEGKVVYSVNCLKGGGDIRYTSPRYYESRRKDTYTGNCRKDGEEVVHIRSMFSPNQDWVLHSKKVFQNDLVIKEQYFNDPYYQKGMIFNEDVVLPYVMDPSLIVVKK